MIPHSYHRVTQPRSIDLHGKFGPSEGFFFSFFSCQIKRVIAVRSLETTDLGRNVTELRRKKRKSGCNSGGSALVSAFLGGLQCGGFKISLFVPFHVKEPL